MARIRIADGPRSHPQGSDANMKPTNCERISSQKDDEDLAEDGDCAPLLVSSPILTEIPVPPLPEKRASNYWVRSMPDSCLLLLYIKCGFSAVSCEHLHLVIAGLPCPGCGPFLGVRAFLAAGVFNSCCKNELSDLDYCPPDGTRRSPDQEAGNGSLFFSFGSFLRSFLCS